MKTIVRTIVTVLLMLLSLLYAPAIPVLFFAADALETGLARLGLPEAALMVMTIVFVALPGAVLMGLWWLWLRLLRRQRG